MKLLVIACLFILFLIEVFGEVRERLDGNRIMWMQNYRAGIREGRIQRSNGYYMGGIVDGKMSGYGGYYFLKGNTYIGQFENGKFHGIGTFRFSNCNTYTGDWEYGKMSGHGTLINKKKEYVYVGIFRNGKENGIGKIVYSNGIIKTYSGYFVDGDATYDGDVTITWPDSSFFIGKFFNGLRTGTGVQIFLDNLTYSGDWLNDKKSGQGTYTWPSGTTHVGKFRDDQPRGYGIRTIFADGFVTRNISGNWINERSAKGIMIYSDGSKYDGCLLDDVPDGLGTIIYSDGRKYLGLWKKGEKLARET